MSLSKIQDMPGWLPCVKCRSPLDADSENISNGFLAYFDRRGNVCTKCKNTIDWWDCVLEAIKLNFMLHGALALAGGRDTLASLVMVPGQTFLLDMDQIQIPNDALIYSINYTPEGNLFPLEIHGNQPQRNSIPRKIHLYARGFAEDTAPAKVNIFIRWMPHSKDDIPFKCLIDAFVAYCDQDYSSMILPANTSVESCLSVLLKNFFSVILNQKKPWQPNYEAALKTILPTVVRMSRALDLDKKIIDILDELRVARNSIGHKGQLTEEITKDTAAKFLCAALFGYHYLRAIESTLEKTASESASYYMLGMQQSQPTETPK